MKSWHNRDRMTLLARMLSIEAKLSKPTQRKLKKSLLRFISGSNEQEGEEWWMPHKAYTQIHEELFGNDSDSCIYESNSGKV